MNRIDSAFRAGRRARRPLFIAYITAGDPHVRWTERLALSLEESGCDLLELGVPFSDPIADGVVNQRAAQRALKAGTTLAKVLACVRGIRRKSQMPIVLFSYLNPMHRMGMQRFAREAAKAGVDGVLILDMPVEEGGETRALLRRHGMRMIQLAAPTSSPRRLDKICAAANGFVYCVSRTGVTGKQSAVLSDVRSLLRRVRARTRVPVAVGFGISKHSQVRAIGAFSDGVVVGSAIVATIEKHARNPVPAVQRLVRSLKGNHG